MFDFCISNPPYQNDKNSSIYHLFQYYADMYSYHKLMIYPADKWIRKSGRGSGLKRFSDYQLQENIAHNLIIYQNPRYIFGDNADIEGGVCIVDKGNYNEELALISIDSSDKYYDKVDYILSFDHKTNSIVDKTLCRNKQTLADFKDTANLFDIPSSFIENLSEHDYISCKERKSSPGDDWIKIYTNKESGTGGRAEWFWIKRNLIIKNTEYIDKYNVSISRRSTSGYAGRSQQAHIYHPGEIHGDVRMHVVSFDNYQEAACFYEWLGHPIIRFLTNSSARRVNNYGINVNVLDNYGSSTIKDEIESMYYNLTKSDKNHIQNVIQELGDYEQL